MTAGNLEQQRCLCRHFVWRHQGSHRPCTVLACPCQHVEPAPVAVRF